MRDFVGNEISPGCFVARGGKGNTDCEYGMIAYHVLGTLNGKIQAERLVIAYPAHQAPGVVSLRKSTISNANSVVVITPSKKILQLFKDARENKLSEEDRHLVGLWLHGPTHVRPWGE